MVHTQVFVVVVVVVVVAEPVPCALVVVMLELLGPVKLELLVVVKMEPVAAILEPVTGPPVDNLEPVESDVPALLVKQAVRYLVCVIEW